MLDLSKNLIHEFYYCYIKNKYGDKAQLLFTDTNSLFYEIETSDMYEDFYVDNEIFDFSEYSGDPKFYDPTHKKVVNKMEDETKGVQIVGFVQLK